MEFYKAFSVFSLGIYSLMGVGAMIALYFVTYGARCFDSWVKRQPMPTDRVWAYLVIAALLGLLAGSFVQGVIEIQVECSAYGQTLGACLFQRASQ